MKNGRRAKMAKGGKADAQGNFKANGKTYTASSGLLNDDKAFLVQVKADNSKLIEEMIENSIIQALEKIGFTAEGYAKLECPVDTGRLRNSITHQVNPGKNEVQIGTNVEYARAVELGRPDIEKYPAQPYLKPAATEHTATYRKILKAELENA